MNRSENQVFQGSRGSAPFWQDKHAQMRVPVASGQPSPVAETAREEQQGPSAQYLEPKSTPKQHSTKRQTVQAAGWIDQNTNRYIVNRLAESRKLIDPKFTRSKVIAEMLKERAADDTFARSQAILAPLIQDVIRAEFRAFTNRFLWIIAKIAYQVGWILSLLLADIRLRRDTATMHQMEVESEKDGRVYVAERSPQVEEAKARLLQKNGGVTVVYSHVNYIPRNGFTRRKAKATLGYNETRKGKEGEEIVRKLFGKTGPLTREQAEWLIDKASENTYFFRWILSPDANEENAEKDLDLWKLARDGVRWLEERLMREGEIELIGAEHNDHTKIPHIHAILLIKRRGREKILTGKDLDAFRKAIHQMALDQRLTLEQTRQQDQEVAETVQVVRENGAVPAIATPLPRQVSLGPVAVQEPTFGTRSRRCLVCRGESRVELIKDGFATCPVCGRALTRRKEEALVLSR